MASAFHELQNIIYIDYELFRHRNAEKRVHLVTYNRSSDLFLFPNLEKLLAVQKF